MSTRTKTTMGALVLVIATAPGLALTTPAAAASPSVTPAVTSTVGSTVSRAGVDARPHRGKAVDPPRKRAGIRVPGRVPGP